jgi:PAS domain S-box-containing protein
MRVLTRLKINAALFAAMMLVITLLFAAVFAMQRKAFQRSLLGDELMRASYELNSLSNRYLRYPEERPRVQWRLMSDRLMKDLNSEALQHRRSRAIVHRMTRNIGQMQILFGHLVEAHERPAAGARPPGGRDASEQRQAQIADLIIKRSRDVSLDAERLAALSNEQVADINRKIRIFNPLVAFVLTALTLWTSLRIGRSIAGPVARLRAGVERVGAGDLDHRIGIATDDEIGQLSAAFDRMTERLKATTVSRDELLKEVAERTRAEEAWKQSDRYLDTIIENAPACIKLLAPDGTILKINSAGVGIIGAGSVDDVLGTSIFPLVLPRYRQAFVDMTGDVFRGRPGQLEFEAVGLQGRQVWLHTHAVPLYDNEDTVTALLGITVDITERKRVEEELRQSQADLNRAQAVAHTGSWRLNVRKNELVWSAQTYDLFGIARGTPMTYEAFLAAVHPHDREFVRRSWEATLRGEPYDIEHRIVVNGRVTWVRERAELEFNAEGALSAGFGTVQDVTDRKLAAEERERLVADLGRSNRELEQFAYAASHDLQEPLRMVASYVQLLERRYRGKLDDKADTFIHYAADGAVRMQKLIDGLLAYSRITRRGAEFSAVDMNSVFEAALSNLTAAARESRARVTKDDLPPVAGDETQLSQLLQNLIGNAIKFTKPDTAPVVHVSGKEEGSSVVFSVRDNGIGIDPEYGDRIFMIFQRLHTQDDYPGTGIGLALCKRIVERHHGRIWVESSPGKGSAFFFTLPHPPSRADQAGKAPSQDQAA